MTTSELAIEFRRIADALDKEPGLKVNPYISISPEGDDKDTFLALARVIPRPYKKRIRHEGSTYEDFVLEVGSLFVCIPRSKLCEIIEPAKPAVYHCPSVLNDEEYAALGEF